jgi:thioredoxin 1
MATIFTDANWQDEVENYSGLVMVDFWATWCGPCQMVVPIIDELAKEYEGKAKIGKMNVDENKEIPTKMGIQGIPAIKFFKNGQLVGELVGAQPKQVFVEKLDELLA